MVYNPLYMKDCLVSVAGTEHQVECSSVVITPTSTTATFKGLAPSAIYTAGGLATWEAALTFAQDWDESTSLAVYLHANEGSNVAFIFEPKDGGASFAATLTVVPGAIGGAVDAFAESTVNMPSTKPVRTPAA